MLFQLRSDTETFRLDVITAPSPGSPPERINFPLRQAIEHFREQVAPQENADIQRLAFWLVIVLLTSGERHHRYLVQRKLTRGTRNIRMPIRSITAYVEETLYPEHAEKRRKGNLRTKKEQMRYDELTKLIRETLAPIKAKLGLPADDPVMYSYTAPDRYDVKVGDECLAYLRRLKPQGILTEHLFKKVCAKLEADFPDDAKKVIAAMFGTQSREHLSAISLTSKGGQLVVSIVNQRGDLVSMEGWKLLRLIDEHDTCLTLGSLDRQGAWQPEPVLELSKNKSGELIGIYTSEDSTLHVVCRQVTTNNQGKVRTATPDRAAFMLDQSYLVSLYVAITQLKEDKKRFEELREQAEAKPAVNLDDLFDPGLFEITATGGHHHDS